MKKLLQTNKYLLLLLFVLCAPAHALGQDAESGNPANWCRNGAFPGDGTNFRLARVLGAKGARVYFYGDDEGCPGPKCRQKAYLIPGNEVIVSKSFGDWLCAWYQPPKGDETVGWIPADRLSVAEAEKSPPPARWLGRWEADQNSLDIRRGAVAGTLAVEGEALWRGLGDNVHTGGVKGKARPAGNVLTVEEEVCRVTLRMVGDYLIASDNSDCGGMNVRFNGVYRRRQARRALPRNH